MGDTEPDQELSSLPEVEPSDDERFFDGNPTLQDDIFRLNVGGKMFSTRRLTLLKVLHSAPELGLKELSSTSLGNNYFDCLCVAPDLVTCFNILAPCHIVLRYT